MTNLDSFWLRKTHNKVMKPSRISSSNEGMKKNTKKYWVINLNFKLWLYMYIFSEFSMEISKQNYLIGEQIFATACYLSNFFHLPNATHGNRYNFLQFFVRMRVFITLPWVAKLRYKKARELLNWIWAKWNQVGSLTKFSLMMSHFWDVHRNWNLM